MNTENKCRERAKIAATHANANLFIEAADEIKLLRMALDALLFVAAKTECKHESQAVLLQEAMDIAVDALKHGGVTNENSENRHMQ